VLDALQHHSSSASSTALPVLFTWPSAIARA
jgi:hypothetical protein